MIALTLVAAAAAADIAVSPLLSSGVDASAGEDLAAALVTELAAHGAYGVAWPLMSPPPGLDGACLVNPGCLVGVHDASGVGAAHLLMGQVSTVGDNYDLFLVLYGEGTILSTTRFQVPIAGVAGGALAGPVASLLARVPLTSTAPPSEVSADEFQAGVAGVGVLDLGDEGLDDPYGLEEDDPFAENDRIEDLDADPADGGAREGPVFAFTPRIGYARFQDLGFLAYGGELGIGTLDPVRIHVGLEILTIPLPDVDDFGNPVTLWRSVIPFNIGFAYYFYPGDLHPYVGADFTLTAYTSELDTAPGGRVKGGFDWMFTEHFGVNLNVSVGGWFGSGFEELAIADLDGAGVVPQASGGFVLAL